MAEQYYKPHDYVDAVDELGGEATTKDIAKKLGRDPSAVRRALLQTDSVECIKVGNHYLHRVKDDDGDESDEENSTDE